MLNSINFTNGVIPTSGATVRTDILLLAISAFTTSMWIIQEVELRQERQSRAMHGAIAEES